jgi:hypothetical protein
MHKSKIKALIQNAELGDGCTLTSGADLQTGAKILGSAVEEASAVTPNAAGLVTLGEQAQPIKRAVLTLTAAELDMAAADNFGSLLLATLPNTNILILGAVVDLAVVMSGFASNVLTTLDIAVGTAATASTDFSGANEDNLCQKIDGVGAGASGTVKGAVAAAIGVVALTAAADNKIYLNGSSPVTTGTGTATCTGTVEILYVERGVAAA